MPNAYALTTRARAKTFLKITSTTDDSLIDVLIDVATDIIEKYCDRRFKKTAYSEEVYDGNGANVLLLKNYPVDSAASFKLEERDSGDNIDSFSEIDSEYYFVDYNSGLLELARDIFQKAMRHYRISYTAGYDFDLATTFLSTVGAADLEWACWSLIGDLLDESKGKRKISSESLGDYSVSYKSIEENPVIKAVLEKYRRPHRQ